MSQSSLTELNETSCDDASEGRPTVLFLQMPWGPVHRPSIAFGILKQLCREAGFAARVLYPNLDLAVQVGIETASALAGDRTLFGLSEHFFAADLFGVEALQSNRFLSVVAEKAGLPAPFNDLSFLLRLRDEVVPKFLSASLARILNLSPRVVGFSSPFNQVMSSLALAARLRSVNSEVDILCGGACFDEEMGREYHRALPRVITHVFLGEAEESFREYLRRLRAGQQTKDIPGTTCVTDGEVRWTQGRPLAEMDSSPMPDYDDYFHEKERIGAETGATWSVDFLPFESSRGCWWGQKSQCIFCGINEELMAFRTKQTARVVQEIIFLSRRYGVPKMFATDWIISKEHRREIFESLRLLDFDIQLFYETRSDMTKGEISSMKEAGVLQIQPGIESFSTPLLRLMAKGTTGLRQVQFLRWAGEYGLDVHYNILVGFPGEKQEWYDAMTNLVPRLRHLQPPLSNLNRVEMHRFSPLFTRPERWGVEKLKIRRDYRFNFPQGLLDTSKVGYSFEYETNLPLVDDEGLEALSSAVQRWLDDYQNRSLPEYTYSLGPGFLHVLDTRGELPRSLTLRGMDRDVALLCDEIQSFSHLKSALGEKYEFEAAAPAIKESLERLVSLDVLLCEGSQYLLLPVARRPRSTSELRQHVLSVVEVAECDLKAELVREM
jgi:ribosomal peptide maturation radical SAM protein 1